MSRALKSHIALFLSSTLFGINFWILKGLMPVYFNPQQIIFLRIIVTTILFWIIGELFYKEKVEKRDIVRLAICSIFGVSVNQIMFIKGIYFTTPVNASFIQLINPILVVIFGAIIIKEKITGFKLAGIVLGVVGTTLLITYGKKLVISNETFKGDLFILINATFYAFYLIFVKPLMGKYNVFTIMKWIFLFGLISSLPYSFNHITAIYSSWESAPMQMQLSLCYVVLISTFVCYLMIAYALKELEAGVTSYYIYIQPLVTVLIGLWLGKEHLDITKIISGLLIIAGVYLVSLKTLCLSKRP
jgi:drug/metabolite transporter (DMT)-like permease